MWQVGLPQIERMRGTNEEEGFQTGRNLWCPPSKEHRSHILQLKEPTVVLKGTKLIDDKYSDYAFTPEPNDPNGPYMSMDHESSEDSVDTDSDWRLRSARAFMLILLLQLRQK